MDDDCICDDTHGTYLGTKWRRTSKARRCAQCDEAINVGELCEVQASVDDGNFYEVHLHMECALASCCAGGERPEPRPFRRMVRRIYGESFYLVLNKATWSVPW